jgi:hypothetical protein
LKSTSCEVYSVEVSVCLTYVAQASLAVRDVHAA